MHPRRPALEPTEPRPSVREESWPDLGVMALRWPQRRIVAAPQRLAVAKRGDKNAADGTKCQDASVGSG